MADYNIGYLSIPVQTITSSQVISANKGRHYVICNAEAGDITVSISGSPKFKYYFVNVNSEYKVNFNINGETAVLSQYDCIVVQKPLDNSADIHVINPTLGIFPLPSSPSFLTYTHTWSGDAQIQSNEADFDGTGDHVSVAGTGVVEAVFNGTGDFTIEIDAHADSSNVDIVAGMGYGDSGWSDPGDNTWLIVSTSTDVQFVWNNSFTNITLTGTGSIQSGMTRVTIVRDSSRISLYVGTSRIATTTTTTEIQDMSGAGTLAMVFGEGADLGANEFGGQIDEVRISGIARYDATDTSITNLSLTNDANVVYLNTFTGANGSTPALNTE